MKDRGWLVVLIIGLAICLGIAVYTYLNPTQIVPTDEGVEVQIYV